MGIIGRGSLWRCAQFTLCFSGGCSFGWVGIGIWGEKWVSGYACSSTPRRAGLVLGAC
ncbi:hypothetical protein C7212DRAFT_325353 [Tuber magnatum]|uniref:Uncharacterized protein n=1 Tax=Tuber magnatum TaxID=42249 RepID=A0A317SP99_9PEZI|nr:hypothetical protein C7212DRAFT_325353 [Tuber magnatum]